MSIYSFHVYEYVKVSLGHNYVYNVFPCVCVVHNSLFSVHVYHHLFGAFVVNMTLSYTYSSLYGLYIGLPSTLLT